MKYSNQAAATEEFPGLYVWKDLQFSQVRRESLYEGKARLVSQT